MVETETKLFRTRAEQTRRQIWQIEREEAAEDEEMVEQKAGEDRAVSDGSQIWRAPVDATRRESGHSAAKKGREGHRERGVARVEEKLAAAAVATAEHVYRRSILAVRDGIGH